MINLFLLCLHREIFINSWLHDPQLRYMLQLFFRFNNSSAHEVTLVFVLYIVRNRFKSRLLISDFLKLIMIMILYQYMESRSMAIIQRVNVCFIRWHQDHHVHTYEQDTNMFTVSVIHTDIHSHIYLSTWVSMNMFLKCAYPPIHA